jgi:hypothetical protein
MPIEEERVFRSLIPTFVYSSTADVSVHEPFEEMILYPPFAVTVYDVQVAHEIGCQLFDHIGSSFSHWYVLPATGLL